MTTVDRVIAETRFEGLTFTSLELQQGSIHDKEFVDCTFVRCKASESSWQRTRLEDCVFLECDLTGMKPQGLIARDVHFRQCKLLGTEWANLAQLPRLAFTESNLHYASFVKLDLRQLKVLGCELVEASFDEVDLSEADFSGSDLRGSTFQNCRLRKTDFSNARGVFFDPSANQVRDALIPVETAAFLAIRLGMRVSGYEPPPATPAPARSPSGKRGGRTRRAP